MEDLSVPPVWVHEVFFTFFFFLSPRLVLFARPDRDGVVGMGAGCHWVPRPWYQRWWGRMIIIGSGVPTTKRRGASGCISAGTGRARPQPRSASLRGAGRREMPHYPEGSKHTAYLVFSLKTL